MKKFSAAVVAGILTISMASPALAHGRNPVNSNKGHKSLTTIAGVACPTVADTSATGFSDLCTAVQAAGLASALSSKHKRYTVFAPTNQAFQDLCRALDTADATKTETCALGASAADIVDLIGAAKVTNVVKYHVIRGRQFSNALFGRHDKTRGTLYKCSGTAKRLTFKGSPRSARTAIITTGAAQTVHVTAANVKTKNGVVHVVDTVLVPNALTCS